MDNDPTPIEKCLDIKQAQAALEKRDVLYDDLYWQVQACETNNLAT